MSENKNFKKLIILTVISFFILAALFVFVRSTSLDDQAVPSSGAAGSAGGAGIHLSSLGDIKTISFNVPSAAVAGSGQSGKSGNAQSETSQVLGFEKDFKGSLMLVNFWASWCEPCVIETPDLIELAAKNPSLKILFVNEDSNKKDLEIFLKSFPGMISERTYVIWDNDRALMKKMNVNLLPESHFFDREGKLIRVIKGGIDWKNFKIE